MSGQNRRVVLASDSPQVRSFLSAVIEQDNGVEVVGQAQNVVRALTMVRSLRPDIAVIDCYLPHSVSLDTVPLSRINGLDAAQAICREIPSTRVILLNNLDTVISPDRDLPASTTLDYFIKSNGADVSLSSDQFNEAMAINVPLFASVEVKPQAIVQQKATSVSDMVIFFGALGLAGGWLLTLTMLLAPVGVPLALAGGVAVVFGLAAKLITSLWRKTKSGKNKR